MSRATGGHHGTGLGTQVAKKDDPGAADAATDQGKPGKGGKKRLMLIVAAVVVLGAIGAGVVGLAIARALALAGREVIVVEAAEGPISSAYAAKFHEAAPNVIRTDHLMSSAHITINEKAFTALPPDMQKLVTDCATDAVQNTRKTAQAETEDVVRKMAAEGAKVTPINKAPIQARAKEGVAKMEKDGAWSSGLWDQIQKL